MKRLKEVIGSIPVVGQVARFCYHKLCRSGSFTTSANYWESRYRRGGDSGAGSYHILAEFKADIINDFVQKQGVEKVIEFGSGDGNQLKYFNFKSYIGFDDSPFAVNLCRSKYKADTSKRFEHIDDYEGEKADLALSLDVIYHLIEDPVFHDYMERLFFAARQFVIIYSSNEDEHENNDVTAHVRHRKFTDWIEEHALPFKLIKHIPNKYPYDGNNEISSYADFYVFKRFCTSLDVGGGIA